MHWRREWQPIPESLPGESHGQRSLVGYSPWGRKESDTAECLHFHFSLSCIGEGNGNPLQCSCLENPRDRGAWWAAVYGVAQSPTRLKQLSSSSSSSRVVKRSNNLINQKKHLPRAIRTCTVYSSYHLQINMFPSSKQKRKWNRDGESPHKQLIASTKF